MCRLQRNCFRSLSIKIVAAMMLAVVLPLAANAQETYYSIFSYDHFTPLVSINNRSASLQASLLPDMYGSRSAARDMRWLSANDSDLVTFWNEKGDTVLHILCELSGIEWNEASFDIYTVRYGPSPGSANPLIIPLGGIARGSLLTAVPTDNRLILNLVFQLSGRMLDQTVQPADSIFYPMAAHPLMEPGPYRRDNLAMLLALATCQNVIGYDSTKTAYESAFWQQNMPGIHVFREHFKNSWVLTPEHTLADQVSAEPLRSKLVLATRPPRRPKNTGSAKPRMFVEGLPLKGKLGFSIKHNGSGQLEVAQIDPYRLAYACGLQEGDIIRRVDGALARNHKNLVERILATYEQDGTTLQIIRDGMVESVVLQPFELPLFDDEFFEDDYLDFDSITADSLYEDY